MKVVTKIEEKENEGLLALLDQRVTLFGLNYIYTGLLVGVNETCVKLDDASIVYETGELTTKAWKNAQPLPHSWYVQTSAIESFGLLK